MNKLERSSYDYWLGGVCGGLGKYIGIDPATIRLIWALCIFMFGFGFILYILCWILIPKTFKY
jgi:phage shock protein PspC (stress-responsive transcriptional regulator)